MSAKLFPLLIHNPFHLTKPLTWLSTAERKFCGSHSNHGAILVIPDDNSPSYIIEAVSHGVSKVLVSKYITYSTDREIYTFIPENEGDIIFLLAQLNKKYQFSIWWSYVGYRVFGKVFGYNNKITQWFGTYNDPNKWFCFELINECFNCGFGPEVTGKSFEDKYKLTKLVL